MGEQSKPADPTPLAPEIWYAVDRVENLVHSRVVIGRHSQAMAMAEEFGGTVAPVVVADLADLKRLVDDLVRLRWFLNSDNWSRTRAVELIAATSKSTNMFRKLLETQDDIRI